MKLYIVQISKNDIFTEIYYSRFFTNEDEAMNYYKRSLIYKRKTDWVRLIRTNLTDIVADDASAIRIKQSC